MGNDGENIEDSMESRCYVMNKGGSNVQADNIIHDHQGIVAGAISSSQRRKNTVGMNKPGEDPPAAEVNTSPSKTSPSKTSRKEKTTTLKQLSESQSNLFSKCTNIIH